MTDPCLETTVAWTGLTAQLCTIGILLAFELQRWMLLRLTDPAAAYLTAGGYAARMVRALRSAVGARAGARRRRSRLAGPEPGSA